MDDHQVKTYVFDIDGTIVTETCGKYLDALPNEKAIQKLNNLFDEGNHIILMSARGMSSKIDYTEFTKQQMKEFGVRYHELIMNAKPKADYYIDDKAINIKDWLEDETDSHKAQA